MHADPIPGQLDIFETIELAERDGYNERAAQRREKEREVSSFTQRERTPWQQLRSQAALKALQEGTITVPLRCGWCRSTSIETAIGVDTPAYHCLPCGKVTSEATAHKLRRQELRRIIIDGIDPR